MHPQVARELLRGMAPVDVRDARGNTVLHAAQMGGIEKASEVESLRISTLERDARS